MPSPVPFAEIRKLLESHGWKLDRINGSHHIFKKTGEPENLAIPDHRNKVAYTYVRVVEKRLKQSSD